MPIQDPLTQQIIGFCYRIANTLGHGFVEKVYENALAFEFRKAKLAFAQQQTVEVFYSGQPFPPRRTLRRFVAEVEVAQGLNYLRATGLPTCLLINFGKAKIEVRRLGMKLGEGAGGMELEVKDVQ